ncbi:MAG: DUF805 domain-containing protein, partial [Succinivibrio sp.]
MTFLQSAKRQLLSKAYFQFSGRASRSEYWWFMLFLFLANIVMLFVGVIPLLGQLIAFLWSLYVVIPTLATLCRRMHDSGHSSLFLWLQIPFWVIGGAIAMVGGLFTIAASGTEGAEGLAAGFGVVAIVGILFWVVALVFFVITFVLTLLPSTPGQNKYGMPEGFSAQGFQQPQQGFQQPQQGFQQPQQGFQQPQQGFQQPQQGF